MADLSVWTRTDDDNQDPNATGWKEGMDRDTVNDRAREMMGALRRTYEDGEWANLLVEFGTGYAVTQISGTGVRVSTTIGDADPSAKFPVGSWIRLTGVGASPSVVLARIASLGTWTTIVDITLDTMRDPSTWAEVVSLPGWTAVSSLESFFARTVKESAFHPVGVTLGEAPEEIPTIDLLSTHVTKAEGDGGGIDADLLDGEHGSYYEDLARASIENDATNADMSVWQDGVSLLAVALGDNNHVADQVVHIAEVASGTIDASRQPVTPGDLPVRYYLASTAALINRKYGFYQLIEGDKSWKYHGEVASFSFWARSAVAIGNIRASVIQWNGLEDDITATPDPIGSWGTPFTEGFDPTLAADWEYCGTPEVFTPNGTWQRFTVENKAVTTSARNVGWMIVIDDASHAIGSTFDLTGVQLEQSEVASGFQHKSVETNISECERFYQKSYDIDVTPGSVSLPGQQHHPSGRSANDLFNGTQRMTFDVRFRTRMRGEPTVVPYSPVTGTSGVIRGNTGDMAASALPNAGQTGAAIEVTPDNNTSTNANGFQLHWTANARFDT